MMLICRLLPLLLVVSWLPSQDDRLSEREAAMEKRIRERAERADGGGKGEVSDKDMKESEAEALERLTPEERLARNVRNNASAFCRFVGAIKPQKLMPGQSGVMVVSALMNGQAVLPSPAPMELIGSRQQGVVSLGDLSFHPAELGTQAAGYAGRPVYDNYAVFEIPVTVAGDATIGTKQPVVVDLRFDIYDGFSAQPIGRFVDRFTTELEVGRALDPAVQGGAALPSSATDTEPAARPATSNPTAGSAVSGPAAGQRWISGQDPATIAEPAPAAEPSDSAVVASARDWTPLPEDSGMLPLPVWIGGGVLLLVIVLMLARKK